jgi:ribosomal protein S18 acetylase RimI-like enzyme
MKQPGSLIEPISRLAAYNRRHGFGATLQRAGLFMRRLFSSNRMVLFYCDFPHDGTSWPVTSLPGHLRIDRKQSAEEIAPEDWEQIVNFWNPELCNRSFTERFREGASMWLIRYEEKLAGYGWTITGLTVEPHYHPLGANDVHMFDFLVFPEYRGRKINPCLVDHILNQLAFEGRTRAYIEVREWNHSQLSSLGKTRFRLLGVARKVSLFGRTFVEWTSAPDRPGSEKAQIPAKNKDAANRVSLASR